MYYSSLRVYVHTDALSMYVCVMCNKQGTYDYIFYIAGYMFIIMVLILRLYLHVFRRPACVDINSLLSWFRCYEI
jgi:hypothetical protein